MAMYGAFSTAMMGMMSQSTALNNIGNNIANVSTGGFKRTDTLFSTVLSQTTNHVSDLGGVNPNSMQRIDQGGTIISSARNLDAAISGHGLFVLNTKLDGTGETFYTRDGNFATVKGADIQVLADDGVSTITSQEAYMVDKNGHYVMAWQPQADGSFNTSGPMAAMRVDAYAFQQNAVTTTEARLDLNLPAGAAPGTQHLYGTKVYDSSGAEQAVTLEFIKDTANNTWTVTPTWHDPNAAQIDTITFGGTVELGDVYSVNIGGTAVTYTANGTEASLSEIRDNIMALANANPSISTLVTATANGADGITFTANTIGAAFTTEASVVQGASSIAQADTVTLAGGIVAGDVYSVTIDGTTFTETAGGADTLTTLRDKLRDQINAHPAISTLVTASDNGTDGIDIVSTTPGAAAYAINTATTDAGGAPASSFVATSVATTYAAIADNTVTTASNFRGATTTLAFDGDASLISPTSIPINAAWTTGTVTSSIDISTFTQFEGPFSPFNYWQNGYGSGQLREFTFDTQGQVQGQFTNTQTRALYRLGLAVFSNIDGLKSVSGNLFQESNLSGTANLIAPGEHGFGSISGNAREMSNVDVAAEFTHMITTQQAYNSSATIFRTVDEMTVTARDLKR